MKKLLFKICIVVLIVAIISVGTFFTVKYIKNNIGDTVVSLESTTALAGDTIKIPFSISKNNGLWGGQIKINYDENAFEFISCAKGDVFDECEVNSNKGSVNLIVNQTVLANTKEDGLVASLNFKVKNLAKNGDYEISFDSETNFCNADAEIQEVIFEKGTITVN